MKQERNTRMNITRGTAGWAALGSVQRRAECANDTKAAKCMAAGKTERLTQEVHTKPTIKITELDGGCGVVTDPSGRVCLAGLGSGHSLVDAGNLSGIGERAKPVKY